MNLTYQAPNPPYEYIVRVPLTKGKFATIDCCDWDTIAPFKWHLTAYGYAATRTKGKIVYMHRLLFGKKSAIVVDHADGDRLNNRRSNLREATKSENSCNWSKRRTDNTSGHVGVSFVPGYWRAYITVNGRQKHVGKFKTLQDAVKARDEAAPKYHGEFAKKNIP